MNFNVKMDDSKIDINTSNTNLKDVLQYCKPKEQLVLLKKFGIITPKETPLQRIWNDYNLTRERVRQIESQALMRFRRLVVGNTKYTSLLDEASSILQQAWWLLKDTDLIAKLVNTKKFVFTPQEIKLILVSDFNITNLKRNRLIDKCFYVDPIFEDALTNIVIYIKNYFDKRKKSVNIYEFIATLKTHLLDKYEEVDLFQEDWFYMQFFKVIRGIVVFDGKVWLDTYADVNPKTIKLKILYTMRKHWEPLHYQKLPDMIMKWFPEKNIKTNTVHNELVKNNEMFVNLWLWIYGLKERWYVWWTVQSIIVRIFKKAWRQMTIKEISKELIKEKMVSPWTIVLNLQKYKSVFERVDKWIYRLKQWLENLSEDEIKVIAETNK